ncbi:histidine phosphatase family protein [Ottowia sp.]|uniref:histidine phosphatase family protein n=1 Tax=Ottowia sp. TaxID=1898956 RepID=UPI001D5D7A29|nr:histidine phosphatase family protein [Ottowia sp.]MCB2033622.1 histidine phosphatase family protein [Ottowia sp.]MCP5258975.1 histidine phosphatase family protein [Burkholderiaceae bacterium]HPR45486.1 histidine phosphatase family protein [Ottowia sp.]HRW70943.1 histidine phosphatase family protein [Ottowia sp.]
MGTLYLVRHGQASFGADDYDRLSDLGRRQSLRLGQYLRQRFGDRLAFDTVLTGTLRRQIHTWEALAEGAGLTTPRTPWPGLNEYDSHAVLEAIHPEPLPRPDTPELYRHHFRLLREGLAAWMEGRVAPRGMPSYADFVRGVTGALDHVREHSGGNALIVSSGGPIATAVGQVLGTAAETTIELNLRIRNTSITEFAFTPKRHMLVTYNTLPHLDGAEFDDWITYA